MKKLQCTNCKQIFWADLQIDESQVASGEWVQHQCPKCKAEWVIVEPGRAFGRVRGRKAKASPQRKGRIPGKTMIKKETGDGFSRGAIKKLRKKLKLSQKNLASLIGVSTGTIVGWESGKFKPRSNKVADLSKLAKGDKEEVENLFARKESKAAEAKVTKTPVKKAGRKSRRKGTPIEPKPPEAAVANKAAEELNAKGKNNPGFKAKKGQVGKRK